MRNLQHHIREKAGDSRKPYMREIIKYISRFWPIILYNFDYLFSCEEIIILKETILSEEKIDFNK